MRHSNDLPREPVPKLEHGGVAFLPKELQGTYALPLS